MWQTNFIQNRRNDRCNPHCCSISVVAGYRMLADSNSWIWSTTSWVSNNARGVTSAEWESTWSEAVRICNGHLSHGEASELIVELKRYYQCGHVVHDLPV